MADAWLPERTLRQHSLTDKMPCMEVDELLNRFGLKEFFPEKITLGDIISIDIHPKPLGLKNIPWLMLRDIINTAETNTIDELLFDSDEHLDVNPLDFLLLILLCCSSSLKQVVAYKLFLCKLSIPLVYPFLDNGKLIVRVWPLQQIIIENKILQKVSVECPCQVISFVRLGRPTISKSKLINELLHEQYHDTFFNRDCPLGTNKRLISEGLIETMWYIPTTNTSKPDDLLELKDVTMFLNLRGDGEDQVQQLDFLSHLSSVIVVVIDISYLNKENDTLFKLPNCKGIVLVIDASQTDRKTTRLLLQTYLKQNSENKHFFGVLS
ncbi:unnamed protein product [Mytilus edulis]|uniref:Up-regulator of cell proliferation-like domain-containing protein n=1 Tax=Mytilus edulis TaxID=6550 RepID=A0A8S3SPB4_MYTED|nr:unnamed protein product [Mytilus edulis]